MGMLQLAGIGVAMGNAEEKVKEIADYVTADIDEGGVAKALKHFHLI
jgi:hydroxymethylpyrimidine pyrophosphatase-like HAD family hydrolase